MHIYMERILACDFKHLWKNNQVIGSKDFVNPEGNIVNSENIHGTYVLSIIGGYKEESYYGLVPKASFLLLQTEDNSK